MPSRKLGVGLRALAALAVIAVPATALAHTVMMTPVPRDVGVAGNDAHKTGPCGAVPRTNKCTSYDAGATIPVKWMETVSHDGCFQIALSTTGTDTNFTVLRQINDPAGGAGMVYPDTVKLPDGVTCKDCTLVVRQLMIGKACTGGTTNVGPFQNDLDASTYYSCADIRIGDPTPCADPNGADSGPVTPDASPGDDGGPTTVPTDGGGKLVDGGSSSGGINSKDLRAGEGDSGCSVAVGATSGVSFAITAGLLGLALARRRRRRP
ncbi:MAG TPA: SCE4755 family polysaccharide monooxygenase-like protein [Labilithrix sp.]|nr:SCE4755 family polysaccharide monooxygenase-like protein [Labilithrix sp.]